MIAQGTRLMISTNDEACTVCNSRCAVSANPATAMAATQAVPLGRSGRVLRSITQSASASGIVVRTIVVRHRMESSVTRRTGGNRDPMGEAANGKTG